MVDADTGLETQAVIDICTAGYCPVKTVFGLFPSVLVHQPIGIVLLTVHICPVLHGTGEGDTLLAPLVNTLIQDVQTLQFAIPIPIFDIIVPIVVYVYIARHSIHVVNGIEHSTTSRTVSGNGLYIVHVYIEMEAFEKFVILT